MRILFLDKLWCDVLCSWWCLFQELCCVIASSNSHTCRFRRCSLCTTNVFSSWSSGGVQHHPNMEVRIVQLVTCIRPGFIRIRVEPCITRTHSLSTMIIQEPGITTVIEPLGLVFLTSISNVTSIHDRQMLSLCLWVEVEFSALKHKFKIQFRDFPSLSIMLPYLHAINVAPQAF